MVNMSTKRSARHEVEVDVDEEVDMSRPSRRRGRRIGEVVDASLYVHMLWSDDLYVVGDDAVCMYVVLDG